MDNIIEQRNKISIGRIFKTQGENRFRIIEKNIIKDISSLKKSVIATGGGAILLKENVDNLKKNGVLIALISSSDVILKRISKNKKRPLLNCSNKLRKINQLLDFRFPYYVKRADYIIDTSHTSPNKIATQILCLRKLT